MLAAVLYASLNTATKARRTAFEAIRLPREASVAIDLVARDLENIPSPNGILAGPFLGTATSLSGSGGDTLDFFAFSHDDRPTRPGEAANGAGSVNPDGLAHIVLTMDSTQSPAMLTREITRNLLSQTTPTPQIEIVCRNVHTLLFRYYDGTQWLDTWDSTLHDNVLPPAIEVTIELNRDATTTSSGNFYRVSRIVPLACSKPDATAAAGGAVLP